MKPLFEKLSPVQRPRRGFALIVALGLMAFLMLLLVSLNILLQVETRSNQQELQLLKARQNAILGLRLALVKIQQEAGPDQVATARADILLDPMLESIENFAPEKLFWTGVWNADASQVRWLVSGDSSGTNELLTSVASPATMATRGLITDADGVPLSFSIQAPRIGIPTAEGQSGSFAYWVGDESLKARIDLGGMMTFESPDEDGATEHRNPLVTAQRSAIERVSGLENFNKSDLPLLTQLTTLNQLANIPSIFGDDEIEPIITQLKERLHDLTPYSLGIIADARNGGLRRDLSRTLETNGDFGFGTTAALYPGGNHWTMLRDFYQNIRLTPDSPHVEINPEQENRLEFRPTPRTVRVNGQHGLFPLLVQWDLGIGFKRSPDDPSRAAITLQPIIAVANPYDVPLVERRYVVRSTSTGSINATREWRIEVDDDGNETLIEEDSGASVPRRNIILQVAIEGEPVRRRQSNYDGHPNNEWTNRLALQTFLPEFQHDSKPGSSEFESYNTLRFSFTAAFEPGEIKWFSLDSTGHYTNWPIVELEEGMRVEHYVWNQPEPDIDEIPDIILPDGFTNPRIEVSMGFPGQLSLGLYLYGDAPPQDAFTSTWLTWAQSGGDGSRVRSSGDIADESLLHTIHAMRPTPRFSSTPVPLSEASINLFTHVARIRGSTETRGPLQAPQIGTKILSLYNLRAPRSSFHPQQLYYMTSPLYYVAFYNDSQFQETEIWEPDAFDANSFAYSIALFHVPRQPVQSIGMLQHANLSGAGNNTWTSTYQVGTSLANPHLPPNLDTQEVGNRTIIDHPYRLNDLLWDRYFFSAAELHTQDGATTIRFNNPRIGLLNNTPDQTEGLLFGNSRTPASTLAIQGPFNINSTSVEAWKAVLSGLSGVEFDLFDSFDGQRSMAVENAILRSPYPAGDSDTANPSNFWRGFRELSNLQVDELAREIVAQIRLRGPFLSIADFVNRNPDSPDVTQAMRGPLQAAIDAQTGSDPGNALNPIPDVDQRIPGEADLSDFAFPEVVPGHRGEGAPGWVTQADVLSQIGSFITSRSDTFLIRTHGESGDDPTAPGDSASAWGEAVVQRLPEYYDTTNAATDSIEQGDSLHPLNERFGRRFRIVAFRWLTEDDL